MQKISPCLWFTDNAEEAINFYIDTFDDSKILNVSRWGDDGPGEPGSVLAMDFELHGQTFMAINGGDQGFHFNESISFFVSCETQAEIDRYWNVLLDGGQAQQCGWLKDKYGVSWQIVPSQMNTLMTEGTPEQTQRVTQAMLQMVKLDIAQLQSAYEG